MRFLTALRLGLRRAHRHKGLIVIAWLAALLPALLISSLIWQDLSAAMDHSPFAGEALSGNRSGVWTDFSQSRADDLAPLRAGLALRFLLVVVLQALVSAGIVETLLVDAPRPTRPFLLGIGRHGWRFLRTLLWFALTVALLAILAGAFFGAAMKLSEEAADASLHVWGLVVGIVLTALLFAFLDLGHDLARIASAAHYDPRTFKGYFLALGHAFKHPLLLLPLWSIFALLGLGAHVGYLVLRGAWSPGSLGAVLLLLVAGQILMLFHAWLRVGLWGSLVAYYQGIGEPRWCIRGRRPRAAVPAPLPAPPAEPETEPVIGAPRRPAGIAATEAAAAEAPTEETAPAAPPAAGTAVAAKAGPFGLPAATAEPARTPARRPLEERPAGAPAAGEPSLRPPAQPPPLSPEPEPTPEPHQPPEAEQPPEREPGSGS